LSCRISFIHHFLKSSWRPTPNAQPNKQLALTLDCCWIALLFLSTFSPLVVQFIFQQLEVLKMGRRWTAKEEDLISQVRKSLKHDLANRPQFPEGVHQV
jgi:hypothetical protein